MVGKIISHYRILEQLGKGGMGVVYKAHDEKLDRTVALKFISPDFIASEKEKRRFLQEAKAAAQLNHPNICSIYSIDEFEGQQFIEMEYVEGETLRESMRKSPKMPLDTFWHYATQLAEALAAAHQKGIIHRDIKPENIMMDSTGHIKIMDFGLAKLKGGQNYTNTGSTLGTLTYMSPEQIRSETVDERSDLFSLGIVLYEMLTGVHPFQAEYQQALLFQILNKDPQPPSMLRKQLPTELETIIVRCLQKDPEERHSSAGDLASELKGKTIWPTRQYQMPLIPGWNRLISSLTLFSRKHLMPIASVGALILLMGFLWIRPFSNHEKPEETIPTEKHLAVLPFNNLSPRDIPPSLNDGIMELLTSHITQLEMHEGSLWVIPSSEVRAANVSSVKEATQIFGANMAVTGSLQHVDDQLLLTINLVDGTTMRQLRSVMLELEWNDQISLQDEIVKNLTGMLEIELEPRVMQSITAGGTSNSNTYQRFIEGQGFLSRFDEKNIDQALEIFQKIIEADPEFVRAYQALAETYWRKYELTHDTRWADNAIRYGQKTIRMMEDSIPEVYITMALINNGMERHEDALKMLEKLNEHEKNSYQAIIEKAKAYEGLGEPEKAEELYHQATEKKKHYWDGYHTLGLFYKNQGRYQEAAKAFEQVTKLAPANARGFTNLGGIYLNLGRIDEGIATLHRSLKIRPTYRALGNLGTTYFFQRDYSQAIRMYEQALEHNDTDRRIWGNLGYAYEHTNQDSTIIQSTMEKAIALTEQELEVTPNNQALLTELAGYHLAIGNKDKCWKLIRRLTAMNNIQPDTRIYLISLFEKLGERDSALHWMETSLTEGDNIEVLESLEQMEDFLTDPRVIELRQKFNHETTQ